MDDAVNITEKRLDEYINYYAGFLSDREGLFRGYLGDLKIYDREFENRLAVNYQVGNNFRNLLTNQVIGYMVGIPIKYLINDRNYTSNKKTLKLHQKQIEDFTDRFKFISTDMSTLRYASIEGFGAQLLFIDTSGNENVINVPSHQCIFIPDETGEIGLAIRYFSYTNLNDVTYYAEVYDKNSFSIFRKDSGSSGFTKIKTSDHYFSVCPLIKFKNNDLELGDWELLESYMDAYDILLSDGINEITEAKLSLLLFKGISIEPEELAKAKNDSEGAISLPEGSAEYLSKIIPDQMFNSLEDRLKRNIYLFAQAVDWSDEAIASGYSSGIAKAYKILSLEQKAAEKQIYFTEGLKQQYQGVCNSWRLRGAADINPDDIDFKFTRNLPTDLAYLSEFFATMYQKIPYEDLLKILPWIDSPSETKEKFEHEQKNNLTNDIL